METILKNVSTTNSARHFQHDNLSTIQFQTAVPRAEIACYTWSMRSSTRTISARGQSQTATPGELNWIVNCIHIFIQGGFHTLGNAWWSTLDILALYFSLWKQVHLVKLHIFDTKHKINTYNKYLTLSDKGPITWSIFNPGVELSSVYRVEISALSVIQYSIKIKLAIT